MKLLTPVAMGSVILKNRIVMPAIATNFGHVDGSVSDRLIEYYWARAEGGVALIIVEFTAVAFEGRFTQNQLRIDQDRYVEGFSCLVEVLHKAGARTMLQLHHSGRRSPRDVTMTQAIAPSAIPIFPGAPTPREMNMDDINHVREAFIQGSVRARQAGFDGVEIHATHGYLLAQFLSPLSNLKSDAYGGSMENRARLPLEILRGIKEVNGQDFPVSVKMTGDEYTSGGIEIEEAVEHARLFADHGADALCVSGSAGSLMAISPKAPGMRSPSPPIYIEPACYSHLAARVKERVSIPVMAIGRINDPAVAETLIDVGPIMKFYLRRELDEAGVQIQVSNEVCEYQAGKFVCRLPDGQKRFYEADLAVLAIGYQADYDLFEKIRKQVREIYIVGDALHPRKILEAMRESFDIAQVI